MFELGVLRQLQINKCIQLFLHSFGPPQNCVPIHKHQTNWTRPMQKCNIRHIYVRIESDVAYMLHIEWYVIITYIHCVDT